MRVRAYPDILDRTQRGTETAEIADPHRPVRDQGHAAYQVFEELLGPQCNRQAAEAESCNRGRHIDTNASRDHKCEYNNDS